jgi:hypothetical protein
MEKNFCVSFLQILSRTYPIQRFSNRGEILRRTMQKCVQIRRHCMAYFSRGYFNLVRTSDPILYCKADLTGMMEEQLLCLKGTVSSNAWIGLLPVISVADGL